ncbi:MAG: succinate dehydrogenase iron-sulfur subunit [Mariprofundales bacterium]
MVVSSETTATIVRVQVWRFQPEADAKPRLQEYSVPLQAGMMVLDALNYIKWELDGSLTYRRSCREGVCGSDGVNINGVNGLACITPLAGLKQPVRIYPLPSMSVIRDLVVDMTHFFDQYRQIQPWLQNNDTVPETEHLQSPQEREKLNGCYECVLCACCSTACPSYWWNGDRFLGPAALLHSERWLADSRDTANGERLDQLEDNFRLYRCHQIMNCMEACPKKLNPTAAINNIKRRLFARSH